jgi:hypothetical protein
MSEDAWERIRERTRATLNLLGVPQPDINALQRQVTELAALVDSFQREKRSLHEDIAALQGTNANLRRSLDEAGVREGQLRAELRREHAAVRRAQEQVRRIEAAGQLQYDRHSDFSKMQEQYEERAAELEEQLGEARDEVWRLEWVERTASDRLDQALSEAKANGDRRAEGERQRAEAEKRTKEDLEARYHAMSTELEKERSQNIHLTEDLRDVGNETAALKNELIAVREELSVVHQNYLDLQKRQQERERDLQQEREMEREREQAYIASVPPPWPVNVEVRSASPVDNTIPTYFTPAPTVSDGQAVLGSLFDLSFTPNYPPPGKGEWGAAGFGGYVDQASYGSGSQLPPAPSYGSSLYLAGDPRIVPMMPVHVEAQKPYAEEKPNAAGGGLLDVTWGGRPIFGY